MDEIKNYSKDDIIRIEMEYLRWKSAFLYYADGAKDRMAGRKRELTFEEAREMTDARCMKEEYLAQLKRAAKGNPDWETKVYNYVMAEQRWRDKMMEAEW